MSGHSTKKYCAILESWNKMSFKCMFFRHSWCLFRPSLQEKMRLVLTVLMLPFCILPASYFVIKSSWSFDLFCNCHNSNYRFKEIFRDIYHYVFIWYALLTLMKWWTFKKNCNLKWKIAIWTLFSSTTYWDILQFKSEYCWIRIKQLWYRFFEVKLV